MREAKAISRPSVLPPLPSSCLSLNYLSPSSHGRSRLLGILYPFSPGSDLIPRPAALEKGQGHLIRITNFTEDLKDTTLYFQIIRLPRQFYVWIGCNSSKFGHLYAAAPTCPNNAVTVAPILGGAADNPGVGIARRLVLKTGLNVMLASNIPNNCPMIEAEAEKLIIQSSIPWVISSQKLNNLLRDPVILSYTHPNLVLCNDSLPQYIDENCRYPVASTKVGMDYLATGPRFPHLQ